MDPAPRSGCASKAYIRVTGSVPRQSAEGTGTIVSVDGELLPATDFARDGFE